MKKLSKKTILVFTMVFCLFALVSIGAAAWMIVGESSETQEGSVTVDTVTDQRHQITIAEGKDLKLVFAPESKSDSGWLYYTGDDLADFKTSLSFSVSSPSTANVTVAIELTSALKNAITNDLIAIKSVIIDGVERYQEGENSFSELVELSDSNASVDVVVEFTWGSKFGGIDPVAYYSSKTGTDKVSEGSTTTWADEAVTNLNSLLGLNGDKAYTLTITTSAKPVQNQVQE